MNPFYIAWIVLFVPYCISQGEPLKLVLNKDPENSTPSHVYLQTHEVKHTLIIHEFSLHETFNISEISLPMLHPPTTDRYEWYIKIFPNYIDAGIKCISVRVYLSNDSAVREAIAMTNISIINDKKEVLHYRNYKMSRKFIAGVPEKSWGWENFCNRDDFFRNHLLQNDTLTLSINIKWPCEQSYEVVQNNTSSTNPTPETTITKANPSENFEWMLENPEFADVVFITNGSNYPAHKSILAARSPVFAAMFRRKDTKNGKLKKIQITVNNMDEEVLRAMLRYIYTGKCENFEKLADKLFVAAAKYGLKGLQKICEETLCETLSVKNAARLLVFAEEHHADKLKSRVKEVLANGLRARQLKTAS
ncbi:speckle-type POZ protein-like [Planococcus citri]|uniref:speckle-type POZ protein-like n=1 Tax=Planococcus citri TaxID=170843 RepID=UPI0031F8D2A5